MERLRAGSLALPCEPTNVVDSFQNNQVANPWLCNHIMVEAGQCTRSQTIREQMVPPDSLIENGQVACAWL